MRRILALSLSASLIVSPVLADPKPNMIAVVAHTDNCTAPPGGDQEFLFAALVSAIIAPLVQTAVKGLGNFLASAGAPDESHVVGTVTSSFYKGTLDKSLVTTRFAKCIVVAAGPAGGEGAAIKASSSGPAVGNYGAAWLPTPEVGFVKAPSLYLEMRIMLSPDQTAWRLVPVHAWFGAPFTAGGIRGNGRDVEVTISALGPSATDGGAVVGVRTISFLRVADNTAISEAKLATLATDWLPLPAIPEAAKTRATTAVQRLADMAAQQKAFDKTGATAAAKAAATASLAVMATAKAEDAKYLAVLAPIAFRVDVHETRDGNKFVAAVGKFLADNSATIAPAISDQIDPAKRAAAAAAAATTAAATETNSQTLRINAITAVDAWETTNADAKSTPAQKQIKKLQAQYACKALQAQALDDAYCLEVAS